MTGPEKPTNAMNGLVLASFQVILAVVGSTASTLLIGSKLLAVVQAVAGSAQYCHVKTTSSAVKSVPSDHLTPDLSFQVMLRLSLAIPPFSYEGISSARRATGLPSGPSAASGSVIRREASASLVPWALWVFRMVGACHHNSFNVLLAPPLAAGAAVGASAGAAVGSAAGAAAGAAVGAAGVGKAL